MKPHMQSSCSCTYCLYGSQSETSSKRLLRAGPNIDRLFYDEYLAQRERKLVKKLIKTRVAYEDIRNQILSRSNVRIQDRGNVNLRRRLQVDRYVHGRSSALSEIVNLVDNGHGIPSQFSDCCSCCTCGSESDVRGRRCWGGRHHKPRGASRMSSRSVSFSKKAQRHKERGVQFKHTHSDPCTCTLKLISKKKIPRERDTPKCFKKEAVKKPVKRIRPTSSKLIKQFQCLQGKSIEKFKLVKYSVMEKLNSMQAEFVRRHETESTIVVDELGVRVRKDSVIKFREQLRRRLEHELECEQKCSEKQYVPENCLEKLNLGRKREKKEVKTSLEAELDKDFNRFITRENRHRTSCINIEIMPKKVASKSCNCSLSLRKSTQSPIKLNHKSKTLFTSTSSADRLKILRQKRKLDIKQTVKKRRSGTNSRYHSASSRTSHSASFVKNTSLRLDRAEKSAPNVRESLQQVRLNNHTETTSKRKDTKRYDQGSQAITGKSKNAPMNHNLRRCACKLQLTQTQKGNGKEEIKISNQTLSQRIMSSSTETNTSRVASLLPFECEPARCDPPKRYPNQCLALIKKRYNNIKRKRRSAGYSFVMESRSSITPRSSSRVNFLSFECEPGDCIPKKCDPYECLALIKKRDRTRKRNQRHGSDKRFVMESKSSVTPMATPHRTKRVQSSMFAYTTEVQTQYNSNYRTIPDETNRIQEIPRLSTLPRVKLSSSFSFNIEISKGMQLPIYQDSIHNDQSRYESPKLDFISKETLQLKKSKHGLKNKKKGPKKVNKGTHATTKSKNRIKCMCKKMKKPVQRPILRNASTTTETQFSPVNVTKATKTKKTRKTVVGPYECEPHICIPGKCNPYECLEIIKRRNQHFSKETGTIIDQKRNKASSSFTKNVKKAEKAVPAQTRTVNQPTFVFNKEARRPAVIKNTSKESRPAKRQAVKIGSSFNFSIEFSKTRLTDPDSYPKFKEKSIQSFENNNESKTKTVEVRKKSTENKLKRCFCALKLRNRKVSTKVFALNKLIVDKNQSQAKKSAVLQTTMNRSLLSFVSLRQFNFKEMRSYFNENKSLYQTRSFHGRNYSSVVDMLSELNVENCYTFSEACCIKRNKKLTAMNVDGDCISYKSFSTTFSRSDVTGVSPLLKRCFCTMNIRIENMENHGRRHKLKPYECEPGVCVPGECNPYDCQKLIQKRLIRKSSKMSGAGIGSRSRSISSSTFGQPPHVRGTQHRAYIRDAYHHPRHRREKPASGIQYISLPNKSHRQAVRIGSSFSFNIEFYKDKGQTGEDRILVEDTRSPHMRSKYIGTTHRGYRPEGTYIGPSTSNQSIQSGIRTGDMHSNTNKMKSKRCFCTLKLQKDGRERQYHDRSNYAAMKAIKATPSMSSTGQNTGAIRPARLRHALDPNECEPGVCVPTQCNPYECLERIKSRYTNTKDFGSRLESPYRSISSMTSKQYPRKHRRHGRSTSTITSGPPSGKRNGRSTSTIVTVTPSGKRIVKKRAKKKTSKPRRQAVRIGSSFSFNVEFFKDKDLPETEAVKESHLNYRMRTSNKNIGSYGTDVRERGAQGHRGLHHRDSQASTFSQMKSTMTSSILKRCFCTAKLQGVKNVPTVLIKYPPRIEKENTDTKTRVLKSPKNQSIKSSKIPKSTKTSKSPKGQKNPKRDMLRSSYTSLTPSQQLKSRKDQKRDEDTTGLQSYSPEVNRTRHSKVYRHYPTRKGRTKTGSSMSGDSSRRQAVRIGSTFSFNVEFYKDKLPSSKAARRTHEQKSQQTVGHRDYRRHRGIGGAPNTFDQMSQVSEVQTNRGMGTSPERNRIQKHQKRSQFDADKYGKKIPPSAMSRGIMTKNRHGWENAPDRRPYKLEPYECEPGVCVPGECDPNECLLRIQKRPLKDSGTTTLYRRGRSVSSVASTLPQYGSRPPRMTESVKIKSHREKPHKYRGIPTKQVVRIGSSYSFNVEFFKDRSYDDSNPRAKAMGIPERKYRNINESSWQGVGSKSLGSQDSRLIHDRYSQSSIPKKRSSMTDAQFLKRCFCTLKLQKSNRSTIPPVYMRNQKIYLATTHTFGPYKCDPGFCIPNQCDPYKCLKMIKQRSRQSKITGTRKPGVQLSSTYAAETLQKTKSCGSTWSKIKEAFSKKNAQCECPTVKKISVDDSVKIHRQAVKIGSNFDFNIEFFKGKHASGGDHVLENEYTSRKSKKANTYHEKKKDIFLQKYGLIGRDDKWKDMFSQVYDPRGRYYENGKEMFSQMFGPRCRDEVSQADVLTTHSKGIGLSHKSCYCTLKLQKLGKHEGEYLHSNSITQTSKKIKPHSNKAQHQQTTRKSKKNKTVLAHDDADVTTQTKKHKLLPYECEPGVCTPSLCDPKECLERIKRQELREFAKRTGKKTKGKWVNVASESKSSTPTISPQRERTTSQDTNNDKNVYKYRHGRQVVRISSNLNFNIEFSKERPFAFNEMQLSQEPKSDELFINTNNGRAKDENMDTSLLEKRNDKIRRSANQSNYSLEKCNKKCQICPKSQNESRGVGTFHKRCFCTLKLQKSYDSKLGGYGDDALNTGEHKVKTNRKKTATKKKSAKLIKGHQDLLPYECKPGVCTPNHCDPHECLERIRQRNKKIGTGPYPYQKSTHAGPCSGPFCTKCCQTGTGNLKKTGKGFKGKNIQVQGEGEGIDNTKMVEERRFGNVFSNQPGIKYCSNQQSVKYGSNVRFEIDFYKERRATNGSKIKSAVPPDDIPTKDQSQFIKNKYRSTANPQSEGIKLENKGTGVINNLKRCFCTLNLQKNAFKSSAQNVLTVHRVAIEDPRVPFRTFLQDHFKSTAATNTSNVRKTKITHTKVDKRPQKCTKTQVLYPYTPRKFNKNDSTSLLHCGNMCLYKPCPHSRTPKGRRLTAKHSEHALKIRNDSSLCKLSRLRCIVSRCMQMFSNHIKDSKPVILKNPNSPTNHSKTKFKPTQRPVKNSIRQSKLSTVVLSPMQSKKHVKGISEKSNEHKRKMSNLNTSSKRKFKIEKAVFDTLQPPRGPLFNNNIICSYCCQLQYENDKRNLYEQPNVNETISVVHSNDTIKEGCDCTSMCKCDVCTGNWRYMLAEQRKARQLREGKTIVGKKMNEKQKKKMYQKMLWGKEKPIIPPDNCARCCRDKDFVKPECPCKRKIPKRSKRAKKLPPSPPPPTVRGPPADASTDTCTCKLPCPCEKCQKNARFSELSDDEFGPQKSILIDEGNCQLQVTEARLCEIANDPMPNCVHPNNSFTITKPCSGLKLNINKARFRKACKLDIKKRQTTNKKDIDVSPMAILKKISKLNLNYFSKFGDKKKMLTNKFKNILKRDTKNKSSLCCQKSRANALGYTYQTVGTDAGPRKPSKANQVVLFKDVEVDINAHKIKQIGNSKEKIAIIPNSKHRIDSNNQTMLCPCKKSSYFKLSTDAYVNTNETGKKEKQKQPKKDVCNTTETDLGNFFKVDHVKSLAGKFKNLFKSKSDDRPRQTIATEASMSTSKTDRNGNKKYRSKQGIHLHTQYSNNKIPGGKISIHKRRSDLYTCKLPLTCPRSPVNMNANELSCGDYPLPYKYVMISGDPQTGPTDDQYISYERTKHNVNNKKQNDKKQKIERKKQKNEIELEEHEAENRENTTQVDKHPDDLCSCKFPCSCKRTPIQVNEFLCDDDVVPQKYLILRETGELLDDVSNIGHETSKGKRKKIKKRYPKKHEIKKVKHDQTTQMLKHPDDLCSCQFPCSCEHDKVNVNEFSCDDAVLPQKYLFITDAPQKVQIYDRSEYDAKAQKLARKRQKHETKQRNLERKKQERGHQAQSREMEKIMKITQTQKPPGDPCACQFPCSCDKTLDKINVNEFSCNDYPTPQRYLILSDNPQFDDTPGDGFINVGHETAKHGAKKRKFGIKGRKKLQREQEREAQRREIEKHQKITQTQKPPGDPCACQFPCSCDKSPDKVGVEEFSCNDYPTPQRYLILSDSPQFDDTPGDGFSNVGHETSKRGAKKHKFRFKKYDRKKQQRELEREAQRRDMQKFQRITQTQKLPGDPCSCEFPCACDKSPENVNVKELTCNDFPTPQRYLILSDSPQFGESFRDGLSNVGFETARRDAKKHKFGFKKHDSKKQQRELEREAQRREMQKFQKITQTQKLPGDPCSCKFPCSCDKSPENVNVKEFSCNDYPTPQRYLILSDSPQFGESLRDGLSNVGFETAKHDAKKHKFGFKKHDRKKQEREEEREAQRREMQKITQTQKLPGDPCSCKFPCSCDKYPENVNVKEFSCNDFPSPQKYLIISDPPHFGESLRDGLSNVGFETTKHDAKKHKFGFKKHEIKNQKREDKQDNLTDNVTQIHKHPGDLCSCKFPCTCRKTCKNQTLTELTCNDWPSPQKYMVIGDSLQEVDSKASKVGYETKNKIKQKLKKRDGTITKPEKEKHDQITQMRKHSTDMCTCKFPCSCQKNPEKLKVTELVCNDWPSPQRYLLLGETSQIQITSANQRTFKTDKLHQTNSFGHKNIQIYTNDQCNSLKENQSDQSSGIKIEIKGKQTHSCVDCGIKTSICPSIADKKTMKNKKVKKVTKKKIWAFKKQNQKTENQIPKHRSGLCTACQKSSKNVTEQSCGDSPIPQKYLLRDKQIDTKSYQATNTDILQKFNDSKENQYIQNRQRKDRSVLCTCKIPYSSERCSKEINVPELSAGDRPYPPNFPFLTGGCQGISQMQQTNKSEVSSKLCQSDSPLEKKPKKEKKEKKKNIKKECTQQTCRNCDDLCICPFPCPCQKCPRIPDVTEFSLNDWPSPQRCLFIDDNEVKRNNIAVSTHQFKTGAKLEIVPKGKVGKLFRMWGQGKQARINEQVKNDKKVTMQGKQARINEQGKNDNKVTIHGGSANRIAKGETGKVKNPYNTNPTNVVMDTELKGKNIKKPIKFKNNINEHHTDPRNFVRETESSDRNANKSGNKIEENNIVTTNVAKDTDQNTRNAKKTKKSKKKLKKNQGIDIETQTKIDSVGDGLQNPSSTAAKIKSMSNKISFASKVVTTKCKCLEEKLRRIKPGPCICGVPECKKEMLESRRQKKIKIIKEKKCRCGVPTCEEKTERHKKFMLEKDKSKKSKLKTDSTSDIADPKSKSKKTTLELESTKSQKSKKQKSHEPEPDTDIKSKGKKTKKSKIIISMDESEFETVTKSKKSKKAKRIVDPSTEPESEFETETKSKKSKKVKRMVDPRTDPESEFETETKSKKSKKVKRIVDPRTEPESEFETETKSKKSKKAKGMVNPSTEPKSKKQPPRSAPGFKKLSAQRKLVSAPSKQDSAPSKLGSKPSKQGSAPRKQVLAPKKQVSAPRLKKHTAFGFKKPSAQSGCWCKQFSAQSRCWCKQFSAPKSKKLAALGLKQPSAQSGCWCKQFSAPKSKKLAALGLKQPSAQSSCWCKQFSAPKSKKLAALGFEQPSEQSSCWCQKLTNKSKKLSILGFKQPAAQSVCWCKKISPSGFKFMKSKREQEAKPGTKSKPGPKGALQVKGLQKGLGGKLATFTQAACLCSHTCLCASEAAKAKLKAKAKAKTEKVKAKAKAKADKTKAKKKSKPKPKKPKKKKKKVPKKKKKKKKVKKKPKPSPFKRCVTSIEKRCERRRRRAARRRNVKKAFNVVKKGAMCAGKNIEVVRSQIAATPAMKSITSTLERHYVSNFILHARDPKKRFNPKTTRQKDPMDFECNLFMGSLRRRPWMCIYYMCPWFYPHCISFLNIWKQFTDVMLFLLAVGVWSPCILCIEICRAFVCCAFCTG